MIIQKRSDSPDEDKSICDSTSLQPVLNDFFSAHPNFKYDTFLGDSAFDKADHYDYLKSIFKFSKVLIPLNARNTGTLPSVGYNEYGYPLCPNDNTLVMKYSGITKEKGRSTRIKWICPKFYKGACHCQNPCSTAKKCRTTYTFECQNFRLLPSVVRNSDEWASLYKIRPVVEQTINHLKTNMCVAGRKSRNLKTTKADLLLASIAQLFTVIVADSLYSPKLLRSLKTLIA